MANRRWLEPSTIQGRQEYRSLRKELRDAGSKKRRQELTAKLDSLYGRGDSEPGTPKPLPPVKPSNKDLQDLVARVKSRPSEMLLSATDIQTVSEMEYSAVRSEWYKVIQTQWPETGFERLMQRGWLLNWRLATLKGTISESFGDYFKRCQERFAAEGGELALLAEKYGLRNEPFKSGPETTQLDSKPFEVNSPAPLMAQPQPKKATTSPEPEPLSAMERAGMDLAQRVNLIFQTDSFLQELAQVNFELNEKIRGALTAELLRVGHVQGSFAAALYNSLRREYKVFRLPERRF